MDQQGIVSPGTVIGKANELTAGDGAYVHNTDIRASLFGMVSITAGEDGKRFVSVVTKNTSAIDRSLQVGDEVICRVVRVHSNQAFVEILCKGEVVLSLAPKGLIRQEDMVNEGDRIVVQEHFSPGDCIRATVVSLGDSKYFYLSTDGNKISHSK